MNSWWDNLMLSCAQRGYKAYGESMGGKNYHGGDMPKWDALPETIQVAWVAAVKAIIEEAG